VPSSGHGWGSTRAGWWSAASAISSARTTPPPPTRASPPASTAPYLSTTVRERHWALGYGSEEDLEGMEDDADELDGNVLDRMVKRVLVT